MNDHTILTVSELNRDVRTLLERGFPLLWLEGEVSNFTSASSGHWYLTLKDHSAQVRCAMFRTRNRLSDFVPRNGMQVLARARVSLYEPRGEFQLLLEHMEEAGSGALHRRFEELKARLQQEGLFDAAHKKPLPEWPRRVGVITSPGGAAVRDIVSVLRRRLPTLPVLIYPTVVQGEGAAVQIVAALDKAVARAECDVLILARGGGSLEDLWCFNDEALARAIHACPIPIVSGVGHEIDFTIADFVADLRAPTPSAAAELVTPDSTALLGDLVQRERQLAAHLRGQLQRTRQRLEFAVRRLAHPARRLRDQSQRVDDLELRLRRNIQLVIKAKGQTLHAAATGLRSRDPRQVITHRQEKIGQTARQLSLLIRQRLTLDRQRLAEQTRALDTVSPLATLHRGYSILSREADGSILRNAGQTRPGEPIHARLGHGALRLRVEEVLDDK